MAKTPSVDPFKTTVLSDQVTAMGQTVRIERGGERFYVYHLPEDAPLNLQDEPIWQAAGDFDTEEEAHSHARSLIG